jgi:hypothetical protein
MKTSGLLIWCLLFSIWVSGFDLNPKLTGLAENSWMILDTTGIRFHGHTAYSGGAYDRANHQFLIFGGGHWDGWHNDILAFDIATGTWQSMYATDSASDHNCGNVSSATPGMLLSSSLPASRHTYDQMEFIDHLGKLIMWSGPTYSGIWGCSGQTTPADTWLYDWAENKWTYENTSRQDQPAGEASCGAYDPVGKLYYAMDRDRYFYAQLWSYNPDTDQWTKLAKFSDSSSSAVIPPRGNMLTTDPKRQRLWKWPFYYDIKTDTWHESNTSGGPSAGFADTYDEVNDVLISYRGSTIYIYHFDEDRWEHLSPGNAPDAGTPYGRFFYNPVDNVVMLVKRVSYRAQVWAYRYKGGAPPAVAVPKADAGNTRVSASPNPFNSMVKIRVMSDAISMKRVNPQVMVYSVNGKQVADLTHHASRITPYLFTWEAEHLPNGIYILKAKIGNRSYNKKLILQK